MRNLTKTIALGAAATATVVTVGLSSPAEAARTQTWVAGNSRGRYECWADGTASSIISEMLVDCYVRDTKRDGKKVYAAVRFIDAHGRWSGYYRVSPNGKSGGALTGDGQEYLSWPHHNIKGVRFYLAKDLTLQHDVYYKATKRGGAV